ncbi:MAG: hypothetical protein HRU14_16665, partial [Planctomycetes bacterium]|nr:hypothetical protein [Planctomycetota bacterium]
VDDDLVARLHARIEAMFSRTTAVRFRSSSNVEDALEFNGAGLYESTGACVADLLDDDDLGPSQCDPDRQPERGVLRALKKVWTSLWTFRAVEERAFFLIPEDRVAMGILVNRAFKAERANGVAFTGNPSNPLDRRYTVVVQVGEESVVSPNPGVLAEKDLLEVVDGEVVRIDRPPQGSSLLPPGEWVLSDEELGELGALLWHIDENFPIDLGEAHERQDVLLDIEFKIESTGELAVKQVRPFLNATPSGPTPSFELAIPSGTLACGVFVVFREPRQEYELKSTVLFVEGAHVLPTSSERFSGELFEEVRVGPAQEHAVALEPGLFKLTRLASSGEEMIYRFEFEQEFELLSNSELFTLRLSSLEFRARGEVPVEASREVDEDFLRSELVLRGGPLGESGQFIVYSSCVYESLPRWRVDIELEGGDSITLRERFEPPTEITLTGPAALAGAALSLGAEQRELSEYWDLVYAAGRHNVAVRYWSILDPPLVLAGVERPVFAVEVVARDTVLNPPIEEAVHYLGEDFEVIATPRIVSYAKVLLDPSEDRPFRRGDANGDGVVEISDVIFLLDALFRAGVSPECLEAADGNGDGRLNVSDPVAVLLYLFGGRDLPEPFEACGLDPTPDGLGCEKFANCPS